jgi:hypothetical protein
VLTVRHAERDATGTAWRVFCQRYRRQPVRPRGCRLVVPAPRSGWRGPRPITRPHRATVRAGSAGSARHPRLAR